MKQFDTICYVIGALLQLATMYYAARMAREATDRRPWWVFFAALTIMFVFRMVFYVWPQSRELLSALIGVAVSALLLVSTYFIRKMANAEREARAAAEHASRMKDDFLATVSHELRTPLNAILGWSQLLMRNDRKQGEIEEGLAVIERNARIQTSLIEDLLDMSRIISGSLRLDVQRTAPAAFIAAAIDTVRPAANAKGIAIEQALDSAVRYINGDAGRCQQIVWNLLSNAIKFTPRGGKVTVLLRQIESQIEIAVTDTGQGIKREFLPFVFDRFRQGDASTTRPHGGVGLGLAIVKQLVELRGGSVRVESPGEGLGATVSVQLPSAPAQHRSLENDSLDPARQSPENQVIDVQ